MVSKNENELLTRVESHAPMGRLMRENYWIPACVSYQLVADGAPLRVRLLGLDFVAFRTGDGRVGLFDERCPHRGTSLVLARNEGHGLRCIFHGWKIDVSGKVVDVPAPKFPELPFTIVPDSQVWMTITQASCNWLQGVEATIDSAHVGTLHEAYMAPSRAAGNEVSTYTMQELAPIYAVEKQPYGLDASARRPQADGSEYVRITRYVMPFVSLTPFSETVPGVVFIASPVDDTHHNLFYGIWSPTEDVHDGVGMPEILKNSIGTLPYDPHNYGRLMAGREDNYGQDRQAMDNGHFSGFTGSLLQEDVVVQASMGSIVDRTRDQLSSSDVAIVHTRRMLLEALEDMAAGRTPRGAGDGLDFRDVIPLNVLVPAPGSVSG